jgi:GNAT superfamily N-acetyltransferase
MAPPFLPRDRATLDAVNAIALEAFRDNALFRWLLPLARQWPTAARSFFRFMASMTLRYGEVHVDDPSSPNGFLFLCRGRAELYSLPRQILLGGLRIPVEGGLAAMVRSMRFEAALRRMHPHYFPRESLYVYLLAVHPSKQRQGIAGNLLDFAWEKARAQNLPLVLETMTAELRDYYGRRGFKTLAQTTLPGGPTIYGMRREG